MLHRAKIPDRNQQSLQRISSELIDAVRHDAHQGAQPDTAVFTEMIRLNPSIARAIMNDARNAAESGADAELSYLKGAEFIVQLLIKQDDVERLERMFQFTAPDETTVRLSGDDAASGLPPAA